MTSTGTSADAPTGVRVALVLVSHAAEAAAGVARIAGQMAPDVTIVPAGGTDDGGLGTSVDLVSAALDSALAAVGAGPSDGSGVVVHADLGSAVMTTESALELQDLGDGRVVLAHGPFLEGAVAAAVAAQQGGDVTAVVDAADRAANILAGGPGTGHEGAQAGAATSARGETAGVSAAPGPDRDAVVERVILRNPLGLHARPAAVVARTVADLGVAVTVDGADGASVLELMSLGAVGGHELTVAAAGPRAREAVDAVVQLVVGGFGEA